MLFTSGDLVLRRQCSDATLHEGVQSACDALSSLDVRTFLSTDDENVKRTIENIRLLKKAVLRW